MPDGLAREMVADWMGAGRAITGNKNIESWYKSNRGRQEIHIRTRTLVDVLVSKYGSGE